MPTNDGSLLTNFHCPFSKGDVMCLCANTEGKARPLSSRRIQSWYRHSIKAEKECDLLIKPLRVVWMTAENVPIWKKTSIFFGSMRYSDLLGTSNTCLQTCEYRGIIPWIITCLVGESGQAQR